MYMTAHKIRIDHRVAARAEEMTVVTFRILIACFSAGSSDHTYQTLLCKGIQGIIDSRSGKARQLTDQ